MDTRFTIVTGTGILMLGCATYFLALVVARNLDVPNSIRQPIAICSAMLWLTTPHPVRALLIAPVLSDVVGSAFMTAWLALLLHRPRRVVRTLEFALVLAAALSRESTAAVVLATCLVAVTARLLSPRTVAPSVIAALIGLSIAVLQPSQSFSQRFPYHWRYRGSTGEIADNLQHWMHDLLGVPRGLLIGLGASTIAMSPFLWSLIRRRAEPTADRRSLTLVTVAAATALGLALIGGRDLGRLSTVAAPFLCVAVALCLFALTNRTQILLAVLGIATSLVAAGAFSIGSLDELSYEGFTLGTGINGGELAAIAIVLIATAALSLRVGIGSELRDHPD